MDIYESIIDKIVNALDEIEDNIKHHKKEKESILEDLNSITKIAMNTKDFFKIMYSRGPNSVDSEGISKEKAMLLLTQISQCIERCAFLKAITFTLD